MNQLKGYVAKAANAVHIGAVYFAMFLLSMMTLITSVNVFMRYALDSGLTWAEEISKLLVVWFTFIAMAIGVKQGLHISLHLLPKNLPGWLEKSLVTLKDVIILVIAVCMFRYGNGLIAFTSRSIMPATEWPGSTLYLILPFAALLICLEVVMDLCGIDDRAEEIEAGFRWEGENHAES